MFNRKSIYALNKKDPNAIVFADTDGNLIRLTCDDFASEEEFLRWKVWSDSDLHITENAAGQTVPFLECGKQGGVQPCPGSGETVREKRLDR